MLCTREPGGSELGQILRSLLLDVKSKLCSKAELFLFLADRAQHVQYVINPALAQGKIVLCDRFIHSTIAYQGGARKLDLNLLQTLNDAATHGLMPDKVLLLDLPVTIGLARAQKRNFESHKTQSEGKFDMQGFEFHINVQNSYYEQMKSDAQRFCLINAEQTVEEVLEDSVRALTNLFE